MPRLNVVLLGLVIAATAVKAEPNVGWRTDGTGRYPDAQPPRTWGIGKNIVWSTKMPAGSVSSPVVWRDRVIVCSEPCTLLCVNKSDGAILWERPNSYQDLVIAPDLQRRIDTERMEDETLKAEQSAFAAQTSAMKKKVAAGGISKEEADKKLANLKSQSDAIQAKRKALTLAIRYRDPNKNSVGGFTPGTPVCDGRHIYVGFGNGLVACYDFDGKRRWLRLIEHSTAPYGHGSSIVLSGERVIVHYADLVGLNADDGSECWRVKLPPNHGTSIATRIVDQDVIVHPNGVLVRSVDGKVLADKLGSCGPNSPILHDGTAYFIRGEGKAVRLPKTLDAPFKTDLLWKARLKGGGYWFASPVLHEGLIYDLSAQGILNVVDAADGTKVYEQRLDFEKGEVYPSVTLAGGLLFVSSDSGATVIVRPGREYREVGRNLLEPFRSTPVFEGKRMYVRTLKNLICIGE